MCNMCVCMCAQPIYWGQSGWECKVQYSRIQEDGRKGLPFFFLPCAILDSIASLDCLSLLSGCGWLAGWRCLSNQVWAVVVFPPPSTPFQNESTVASQCGRTRLGEDTKLYGLKHCDILHRLDERASRSSQAKGSGPVTCPGLGRVV